MKFKFLCQVFTFVSLHGIISLTDNKEFYQVVSNKSGNHHQNFDSGIYIKLKSNESNSQETLCKDGHVFSSLSSCQQQCSGILDNLASTHQEKKLTHKIVVFNHREFTILPNGSLYLTVNVPLRLFSRTHYFLIDSLVHVCYPLNRNINSCIREILPSAGIGIHLLEDNRIAHVKWLDQNNLTIDQFYVDEEGVHMCKIYSKVIIVYLVGYFSSVVAMLVTITMMFLVRTVRKTNNEALLCHIVFLMLAFAIFAIEVSTPAYLWVKLCPVLGYLVQFCFISAFAWMNIFSYSLHKTFTNLRPISGISKRRFFFNCFYGIGIPLIISILTIITEIFEAPHILNPNFKTKCWFSSDNRIPSIIFFYAPLAISIFVNIYLFTQIVHHTKKLGREVSTVNKEVNKQMFFLAAKLFVVMGLGWLNKFIVWPLADGNNYWRYMDSINTYHGIFIFLIYVPTPQQIKKEVVLRHQESQSRIKSWFQNSSFSSSTASVNGNPTVSENPS